MRSVFLLKHVWMLALKHPRHVWVLEDNCCPCKHSVIKPLNKLFNELICLVIWVLLFSCPEAPALVFSALIWQGNQFTADLRLFGFFLHKLTFTKFLHHCYPFAHWPISAKFDKTTMDEGLIAGRSNCISLVP